MRGTRPLIKFIYISPRKPHCYAYKYPHGSKAHQKSYNIHTAYIYTIYLYCFYLFFMYELVWY